MDKFDDVSKTIESSDLFKSMENSSRVTLIALCVDVFKLGEKSKQAEIDELRKGIDLAIESLKLVNHSLLYEHIDHIINLLDGTTNEQ